VKAFEKEPYHRRKASEKPFLTQQHIEHRLKWAWEHLYWTEEQWDQVAWGDEMSECCIPKFSGYSSGQVWGIISRYWKGPLIFFKKEWLTKKGTVDSRVYIRQVLPIYGRQQQDPYI